MPHDVFISYARASAGAHATAVASAFERKHPGRLFLDTREMEPGAPFPDELGAAVAAAKVVLVFLDATYFNRLWCVRELEAALEPDGRGRCVQVALPPETNAEALLLHLPPDVARRSWPKAHETDLVVHMIERALAGRADRDRVVPADSPLRPEGIVTPGRWRPEQQVAAAAVPDTLGPRFVGREETLWRIFRGLETRRAGGRGRSVLLAGAAGTGKSQLGAEYFHRAGPRHYDVACWLDADVDPPDWSRQLAAVLPLLESAPAAGDLMPRLAKACEALDQAGKRVLWVVDNVPEPTAGKRPTALTDLCPAPAHVSLLATSRRPHLHGCDEVVPVDVLEPADAVRLITQPDVDPRWLPSDDWAAIARWVGRLPLALRILQAGLADGSLSADALRSAAAASTQEPAIVLDQELELLAEILPLGALRGVGEALASSYDALTSQPGVRTGLLAVAHLRPWPLSEQLIDLVLSPGDRAVLARRGWLTAGSSSTGARTWRLHRVAASFVRRRANDFEGDRALLERLTSAMENERLDAAVDHELGHHLAQMLDPMVERINAAPTLPQALVEAGRRFGAITAFYRLSDEKWRGIRYLGAGWARTFGAGDLVAARAREELASGDATRTAALPALLQPLGGHRGVCALAVEILADSRDAVRWQALVHMSSYAAPYVIVPFWAALVAEPNERVRRNTRSTLNDLMGAPDAPLGELIPQVAPHLSVPDPNIRALAVDTLGYAIQALGQNGVAVDSAKGLRHALVALLDDERDPDVVQAIGSALGVRHDAESWHALAARLEDGADADTFARACKAFTAYLGALELPAPAVQAQYVIDDDEGTGSLKMAIDKGPGPRPDLWDPLVAHAVRPDGTGHDRALAALDEYSGGRQALARAVEALLYENNAAGAAIVVAERCLAAKMDETHPLWWRGIAREHLGDAQGALADFVAVAERQPRFGYPFKRIARLRLAAGDVAAAREALARAQALIADDPEVIELTARIGTPGDEGSAD